MTSNAATRSESRTHTDSAWPGLQYCSTKGGGVLSRDEASHGELTFAGSALYKWLHAYGRVQLCHACTVNCLSHVQGVGDWKVEISYSLSLT